MWSKSVFCVATAVISGILVSCGNNSPVKANSPQTNISVQEGNQFPIPQQAADPVQVAKYLQSAGFTKKDAQGILDLIPYVEKVKEQRGIHSQSLGINDIKKSMEIILLDASVPSQNSGNIEQQAVTRSLIVNAASNIALGSTSNFNYYQSRSYLGPGTQPYALTYDDDGCSAPDVVLYPTNFIFYPACDQHDFGYRNGLFSELHNPSFKASVDTTFLNNMKAICEQSRYNSAIYYSCINDAALYYTAVGAPIVAANWLTLPSK